MTPVLTPADDSSKVEQALSDGEPAEDGDYDTDLDCEEPREEYDRTGKLHNLTKHDVNVAN